MLFLVAGKFSIIKQNMESVDLFFHFVVVSSLYTDCGKNTTTLSDLGFTDLVDSGYHVVIVDSGLLQ